MKLNTPVNNQILEEASYWFATFRSQDLSEVTRQHFQDWLKRSPEHIRAYLEIAAIYADIPAPEHGHTPPELIARAKVSPEVNVVALSNQASGLRPQNSSSTKASALRPQYLSIAASIVILAFLGAWLYTQRNTYQTDIGEQRSITMTDGSIIELNARSKVHIRLDDNQRDVELLEGQALFRVAKDPSRPFTVHAGPTTVRAVGTQFDVNRKSNGTIVTVLEGQVAISSAEASGLRPKNSSSTQASGLSTQHSISAGEQLTVTPTHARKAERPNIAAATAWTQHQLVFDGTPLREVIEEFSRYTSRRLIVDTTELAELKISGQYTSASPDSLLRFLSMQQGVVVTEVNGETHISQLRP